MILPAAFSICLRDEGFSKSEGLECLLLGMFQTSLELHVLASVAAVVFNSGAPSFSTRKKRKSFHSSKVTMRLLNHKRIEAPRVPTFEDVHPYTTWNMCVRVFHKFQVERFAIGRRRFSLLLLDEKGKKMAAVIYDDQVDRFEPLLVEGRVYYVWRMSAEPVTRNQDYMFADSHFVCCFTSQTVVDEMRTVSEQFMPLYPPLLPFDKVWKFTMDNDMYVDVIGMVLYVSSVGFKDSFYNRRIPFRNVCLMDGTFNIVKLVVWDKVLTGSLIAWEKSAVERAIVVATMLRAKPIDHGLHTTDFSRVYFNPDAAIVRQLRQRINNDLDGLLSLCANEIKNCS